MSPTHTPEKDHRRPNIRQPYKYAANRRAEASYISATKSTQNASHTVQSIRDEIKPLKSVSQTSRIVKSLCREFDVRFFWFVLHPEKADDPTRQSIHFVDNQTNELFIFRVYLGGLPSVAAVGKIQIDCFACLIFDRSRLRLL